MPEPVALNPRPTDKELADRYRAELGPALDQVADIFSRAKSDGLIISFSIAADARGRSHVSMLTVVKEL